MTTPIKISAVSAIAIAMLATPAFAQTVKEETDFDGIYVGGHFGYSAQSNDRGEGVEFDTNVDGTFNDTVRTTTGADAFAPGFCKGAARANNADGGCRNDKNDIEYGIRIGADKRFGNFVVGALIEGSRSEATDSVTAFSSTPANYTFTRELDYAGSARLRAGYTPGGGILFYGTGGATYGRIKNSFQTSNAANSFTPRNGKDWSWGWQAGGGVEAKIASNLSIGLEYLYNTYTGDDYVVNVGPGSAPATNPFLLVSNQTDMRRTDSDFDFHSIRVTTAFRF